MIRRLIILLLIVGCVPTKPSTATFYVGMPEEKFIKDNNFKFDKKYTPLASKSSKRNKIIKINSGIFVGDTVSTIYAESQKLLTWYYFEFSSDTLSHVYAGLKNWIKLKEIDYSKYPGSKPE